MKKFSGGQLYALLLNLEKFVPVSVSGVQFHSDFCFPMYQQIIDQEAYFSIYVTLLISTDLCWKFIFAWNWWLLVTAF